MPYLFQAGVEAHEHGVPVLRPMALEFDADRGAAHVDTQYMLGPDLLVAPVFRPDGTVEVYLPEGTWTNWFTGETVRGGGWRTETHGFDTLPLYVRDGAVVPVGARDDVPDYDHLDGLTLRAFPASEDGIRTVTVTDHVTGEATRFDVERRAGNVQVRTGSTKPWRLEVAGTPS
jgi:alpha-D-xyloside xylohydrolase